MPLQRQRHLARIHAAAIVAHFDAIEPPVGQPNRDAGCPCIQRIFDDFLERAGGSFDHFTGSDTIDQMFGQTAY